ncbi:hypothetical protein MAR_033631, partial [Mya arenaria]
MNQFYARCRGISTVNRFLSLKTSLTGETTVIGTISIYRPHDSDWFLKVSPTRTSDADAASITGYQSRDVYLRVCEGTTRVKMWCNVTAYRSPPYVGTSSRSRMRRGL